MNRFVYLYELDSVRNDPKEIELGQAALFEEIVKNGNTVVLAFNQLADSEAFLSAVKDKETYESIVELFALGALKVSQFGNTRTASQYMQNSIEKCLGPDGDKFLFSGIPVLCTDRDTLKIIQTALKFSDVGILRELAAAETKGDRKAQLEYIERFVRLILLLSVEEPAGHPAKQEKKYSFTEFYARIFELLQKMESEKHAWNIFLPGRNRCNQNIYAEEIKKLVPKSLKILCDVEQSLETGQKNNRTNWVNEINACAKKSEKRDAYCLAEAIVDLCYNYTVEDSIYKISRHYLEQDNNDENGYGQFADDFIQRLTDYWKSYKTGIHTFCKGDRDEREEYRITLPCWDTAVRIVRASKKRRGRIEETAIQKTEKIYGQTKVGRCRLYEENYKKEREQWRCRLILQMGGRFGTALIYIALFCLADLGISLAEDNLFETVRWLQPDIMPEIVWNVIYSTVLFGIIGSVVAEIFHLPDILESLKGIVTGVKDSYRVIKTPRHIAYYNRSAGINNETEQESEIHV